MIWSASSLGARLSKSHLQFVDTQTQTRCQAAMTNSMLHFSICQNGVNARIVNDVVPRSLQ